MSCERAWPHRGPSPTPSPGCRTAGIEKYGGRVLLRTHVDQVLVEGGRAAGVRLRPRSGAAGPAPSIRAKKAVLSNASVWDTLRLLPQGERPLAGRGRGCCAAAALHAAGAAAPLSSYTGRVRRPLSRS